MGTPFRLLVVEDEEADTRLILLALRACGVSEGVQTVADGKEALDYLYRRGAFANRVSLQPALVLMDLHMPRVDGFGVLSVIKSDSVMHVVPVVVLTSSREARDLAQAYALGADGYVVMPMGFDACVTALGAVCRFWLDVNEAPAVCQGSLLRSNVEEKAVMDERQSENSVS